MLIADINNYKDTLYLSTNLYDAYQTDKKFKSMKNTNFLLLLFAAFMITFTSCTEDPISKEEEIEIPVDVDEDQYNPLLDNIENRDDLEGGLELGCFSIDTPFSLDIDGTIVEINTYEDLENAFTFDDEDVAINVDFVYPLAITYEDGQTAELADGEALGEAFALCIPDEGWEEPDSTGFDGSFPAFLINDLNSCYELVYPVTLQDWDGVTYTANDEDELIELLAAEEALEFVLPLSLEGEDGVVTATTVEELFDLLIDCQDQPWEGEDDDDEEYDCPLDIGGVACYDLTFPVSFEDINGGDDIVVNNYEELSTALLNGNIGNFVYPITLVNVETEETTVVNDDEEFAAAIEECFDGVDTGGGDDWEDPVDSGNAFFFFLASDDFDGDCYSIIYPVTVTTEEGEATYSSIDDLTDALNTGENLPIDLVFPVSVTNSQGEDVTLESNEDFSALLEDCQ